MPTTGSVLRDKSSGAWAASAVLGANVFAAFVAMYLPQPLLPMIARDLGGTPTDSALLVSIVSVSIAWASPALATISDRVGRRHLLMFGSFGMVPVTLGCSLAPNLAILLACRGLQGVLVAIILANAWAYLGEELGHRFTGHAAGALIAVTVTGGVVSRLLGGTAGDVFGWRGAFLASAAICLLTATFMVMSLPGSRNFRPARGWGIAVRGSLAHWRHRDLRNLYILGFALFFSFLGVFNGLPFVLEAEPYSLSPTQIGLIYLTYLAGIASSMIAGPISALLGTRRVLIMAGVATAAAHAASAVRSLDWIVVTLLVLCFSHFLAQSISSGMVASTAQKMRAGASAHYLFAYYFGGSVGSVSAVAIWQVFGWTLVAVVNAGIVLLALVCMLRRPSE